jgi:hypothetical protein
MFPKTAALGPTPIALQTSATSLEFPGGRRRCSNCGSESSCLSCISCRVADKRYLFPEGVKALGDAVDLIAAGEAPRVAQPEEGATYDPLWKVRDLAQQEGPEIFLRKRPSTPD